MFPTPLPKLNNPKIACEADGSSVTAVTILAHMAVYPAPKNPYSNANNTRGLTERASPQALSVATAATDAETVTSALTDVRLSESYPNVNWPAT